MYVVINIRTKERLVGLVLLGFNHLIKSDGKKNVKIVGTETSELAT